MDPHFHLCTVGTRAWARELYLCSYYCRARSILIYHGNSHHFSLLFVQRDTVTVHFTFVLDRHLHLQWPRELVPKVPLDRWSRIRCERHQ
jgi:hypothetical protein